MALLLHLVQELHALKVVLAIIELKPSSRIYSTDFAIVKLVAMVSRSVRMVWNGRTWWSFWVGLLMNIVVILDHHSSEKSS